MVQIGSIKAITYRNVLLHGKGRFILMIIILLLSFFFNDNKKHYIWIFVGINLMLIYFVNSFWKNSILILIQDKLNNFKSIYNIMGISISDYFFGSFLSLIFLASFELIQVYGIILVRNLRCSEVKQFIPQLPSMMIVMSSFYLELIMLSFCFSHFFKTS